MSLCLALRITIFKGGFSLNIDKGFYIKKAWLVK